MPNRTSKFIVVDVCAECPHLEQSRDNWIQDWCHKANQTVKDIHNRPIWCPLPDLRLEGE